MSLLIERAVMLAHHHGHLIAAVETRDPALGVVGGDLLAAPLADPDWRTLAEQPPRLMVAPPLPGRPVLFGAATLLDDRTTLLVPVRSDSGGALLRLTPDLAVATDTLPWPLHRVLALGATWVGLVADPPTHPDGPLIVSRPAAANDGGWHPLATSAPFSLGPRRRARDLIALGGRPHLILDDDQAGFEVWRGPVPGADDAWTPILTEGAGRHAANAAVTAILPRGDGSVWLGVTAVHRGPVPGGDWGPELIALRPDGTWDLVVGQPRFSPEGVRVPLAALGPGWGDPTHAAVIGLAETPDGRVVAARQAADEPTDGNGDGWPFTGQVRLLTGNADSDWHPLPVSPPADAGPVAALCALPDTLALGHGADPEGDESPLTLVAW